MKILLGIERTVVSEAGLVFRLQSPEDTWEVGAPDARQYLASIWMTIDGAEVLRLPLDIVPGLQAAEQLKP